ncbi:WXG100 family type VII secretion target [Nocardia beijingensis]|uniref:WXG100 family type VII secretion target n=1 Tax=Nocardia beijingensis TaxID=95162 RepID=UPI0018941287|nr:WXG100 family type VII secretion target [Nocardia beijingensis]MBF6469707.1 WXG100 family type VII secretion target [Nocardia beijingensis]
MCAQFEFDLDHIDQVTARARGFKGFFADHLDQLESRVQDLVNAGRWTGEAAAAAYAQEHQDWMAAARELLDGLAHMEQAARAARDSYANALDVNRRMTGG